MNKALLFLAAAGFVTAFALGYGGTRSNTIAGNTVIDLYFDPTDSNLFALSTAGLSYTNAFTVADSLNWDNFGKTAFGEGLNLQSVAANHQFLVVTGFSQKDGNYRGGNIFYKSKGGGGFTPYFPAFKDNDDLNRLPSEIYFNDSTFYVSLFAGTLLKNKVPASAGGWRAVLVEGAPVTDLIAEKNALILKLTAISDSLSRWIGSDSLTGSPLVARLSTATDTVHDPAFSKLHFHRARTTVDSFFVDWDTYQLATSNLVKDTLHLTGLLAAAAAALDSLATQLIPLDTQTIARYTDTLRSRYDTLVSELSPAEYPPPGYSKTYTFFINSVTGRDSLLLLGTSGGLLISTDRNRSFREMLHYPGSPLLSGVNVPEVADGFVEPLDSGAFRVWIKTKGDTLAYSAPIPSTALASDGVRLLHEDSLKKWTLFDGDFNPTDIEFFKGMAFVSFGSSGRDGLRKYYQIDTLKNTKASREWRFKKIELKGFIEPQLGINTLLLIPRDSIRYDLWAGTDDGLYRSNTRNVRDTLDTARIVWTRFEYKKDLGNSNLTYAYPTVIQPGYKSAKIAYSLSKDANVTIDIYDFSMRKVRTLIKGEFRPKGQRSDNSERDRWDGRDDKGRPAAAGVYYYRISAGSERLFGKIMVFGAKDY